MFVLDLYAWWNAAQLAELLRGVTGIVDATPFRVMLCVVALFGLLAMTTSAVIRYRAFELVSWFFAVVLLWCVAIVPRVAVTVSDTRAASAQTVENVPLGLALPAVLSSKIGRSLATMLETALGDVEAARFTSFGAVFPERAAAAIAKAGPITSTTRALLNPFIERCVIPEVLESDAKMSEVLTSANLVETVTAQGWSNPARIVLVDGSPQHCQEVAASLLTVLRDVEIPAQERLLLTKLSSDGSEVAEAAIRRAIPESTSRLLGLSQTLAESLGHAVLLSEIPRGLEREAARMEEPLAGAIALARAQGSLAAEISFRTMGELAAAFLPKLRNLLEFILIAVFPVVVLMLVAAGSAGTAVARMYLTLFLWLALWAPVATVINALLVAADATPLGQLTQQFGGLTLEAADLIRDVGASAQAMAGYLMMLVPLISYLIAKASDMGAASLASSVMGPAAGAAQSQSAAISAGNVAAGNASLHNTSLNNTQANKSDSSTAFTAGSVTHTRSAWGAVTRDGLTGAVSAMEVARSDLGVSAASSLVRGEANSVISAETSGALSTESAAASNATVTSSGASFAATGTISVGESDNRSSAQSSAVTQSVSANQTTGTRNATTLRSGSSMAETFGLGSETQIRVGAGAAAPVVPGSSEGSPIDFSEGASGDTLLMAGTLGAPTGAPSGATGNTFAAMPTPSNTQASRGAQTGKSTGSARAATDPLLSGEVSSGGKLRTITTAGNTDETSTSVSAESGNRWEARSGEETRSTHEAQTLRSDATLLSASEARTSSAADERRATRSSTTAKSTGATHATSAGRTAGRQTGTDARLDSWLVARAIDTYGSPEAALEALANPAERAAFAGGAMAAAEDGRFMPMGASMRAPSMDAVRSGATAVGARTPTEQSAIRAQSRIENSQLRSDSARQLQTMRSIRSPADTPVLHSNLAEAQRLALETERGATIAADTLWRERTISASGVLSTALFAGITYDSPEALRQDFIRSANHSDAFAKELRDVAQKGTVRTQALESLSREARQRSKTP